MKKIFILFAVVGLVAFSSCEGPEGPEGPEGIPGQSVNRVYELVNVDFGQNAEDGYNISGTINPLLTDASTVLIYRLVGTIDAQTPVWQLIPVEISLTNNRNVYYDYDFSKEDYKIYVRGNYDLETTAADFLDDQTFRLVFIPGSFINKSVNKPDYSDYYKVIKEYNIDDSNVKRLN